MKILTKGLENYIGANYFPNNYRQPFVKKNVEKIGKYDLV